MSETHDPAVLCPRAPHIGGPPVMETMAAAGVKFFWHDMHRKSGKANFPQHAHFDERIHPHCAAYGIREDHFCPIAFWSNL